MTFQRDAGTQSNIERTLGAHTSADAVADGAPMTSTHHHDTPRESTAEIYVSTDVEADGPIPGPHSMLGFASAAFASDKTLLGTFAANLTSLPGATGDPATMAWWHQHPDAWAASRNDPREPAEAMPAYLRWLEALPGTPVFVAHPAAYDFMFIQWYLVRFTGQRPFGQFAIDLRSFAMALLGSAFGDTRMSRLPAAWHDPQSTHHREHVALDDAISQGRLFCNMFAAARPASDR